MKALLTLTLLFSYTLNASSSFFEGEAGSHTSNYCDKLDQTVCGHVKFLNDLSSTTESQFVLHILPDQGVAIDDVNVILWMQMGDHGHGSSPVTIENMEEPGHFKVSEAYFVMKGKWLLKVSFKLNGRSFSFDIPVNVVK